MMENVTNNFTKLQNPPINLELCIFTANFIKIGHLYSDIKMNQSIQHLNTTKEGEEKEGKEMDEREDWKEQLLAYNLFKIDYLFTNPNNSLTIILNWLVVYLVVINKQ